MKLTNQQVDALANKIYDELLADAISDYNSNMAIIKKEFEKTKECAAMHTINNLFAHQIVNPQTIMGKLYDLPKSVTGNRSKIRNEIILSTIDCADLNELIEKVKASVTE